MSQHATLDFETKSPAGNVWVERPDKWNARRQVWVKQPGHWVAPNGAKKRGISAVGANVYCEHPGAGILSASYRLPVWWNGGGVLRRWRPGLPNPQDLFDYLAAGGTLECHNVMFERLAWFHIATRLYGWPSLEPYVRQLRCSMATARVNSLPGALGDLSAVLRLAKPKDKEGTRLLNKFTIPQNPTAKDPRIWILPADDPEDAEKLYAYNDRDVESEEEASSHMLPMSDAELEFWLVDQEINWRGVAVDVAGILNCEAILAQALDQYGEEYRAITGLNPTQLAASKEWLAGRRCYMDKMDEEAVDEALTRPLLPPDVRRVLEIRQLIGSASVKKLHAMTRQVSRDGRLRNLIVHHGARTGRPTGEGPQPLNLPRAGPKLVTCAACSRPHRPNVDRCLWCNAPVVPGAPKRWSPDMADHVLSIMAYRSLALVEWFFGDALLCISGCIRSLFTAGPGCELIASDYSAIEAVVTAMLAGEQWRIDAFRERKKIYLLSAAKITGRSYEFYLEYAETHGEDHPDRQKIGKVSELGLGFGGWIGAWRQFDDTDTFTDNEVKANIIAWREASPKIVELWGGQWRGPPWRRERQELFGFEGCAVWALLNPGQVCEYAGIKFELRGAHLIVTLLSGRELTYRDATLTPSSRNSDEWAIVYWTWNTNPKYGPKGWVPMSTFGGRLAENIIQATAHDILRHAILNLRAAGYHTVLHVYDEIVVEVTVGSGSIEEVERIMATMPWWAAGWPVVAAGGWRGVRYRKG